MAIQQVASGGSNGILGFLFQDEGGSEGTVLEGAEFARTLRGLLGEEGAPDDAAAPGDEAGTSAANTGSAPPSAGLDALAGGFTPPAQDMELQPDTANDGNEADAGRALWDVTAFAEMMAMNHAQAAAPVDAASDHAKALADAAQQSAPNTAATAPAPSTGNTIQNMLEPTRDAEQAATQAAIPAAIPAPYTQSPGGRSTPASGKFLPQGYRAAPSTLSQAMTSVTARSAQAANAANDALPVGGSESAFSSAFNNNFISELLGADARTAQASNPSTPNVVQGLSAARIDNPLPAAAKAAVEPAPMPSFDSPFLAGSDAWFEDLGTRLEWLTDMNIDKAELQLHPAELGLLEIQIATGDDGTSVSFVTHNPEARALIEDSMPKLRELLAHQGLQLGDSQVSQQSPQQREGRDMSGMPSAAPADPRPDDETSVRRTVYVRDPGRIDHYV